jgi:predicted Zn-dependent protease
MKTLRDRWAVVCCVVLLAAAGCQTNAVTGRLELMLLSEQQEVSLGHENHPNIIFMYDGEYQDPELNRYLGTITMRLHRCSHRPHLPVEFTMLNTSMINAFATPAHVYATRGFLARLENEAQFAAVMGHELGHVTAGHSAKQLSNAVALAVVLGLAGVAAGDSGAGAAAVEVGQVGVTLLGLSYSREQERQADRLGTYYMSLAGWDPEQAIRMQALLHSLAQHQATWLDEFLSTHPPEADRVREIEGVIDEKDLERRYVQGDGVYGSRWSARLRRLREVNRAFGPYDRGMKHLVEGRFGEALAAANESIGIRSDQAQFYRLRGDALLGLARTAEAKAAYNESLARDRRYVPANLGLAKAYLAEGDEAAAEREFEKVTEAFPGSVLAHYGLGLARVRLGRYREAITPLEAVASAAPREPQVHYLLGVCYDRTGQRGLAYQAYHNALATGLSGPDAEEARSRLRALSPR